GGCPSAEVRLRGSGLWRLKLCLVVVLQRLRWALLWHWLRRRRRSLCLLLRSRWLGGLAHLRRGFRSWWWLPSFLHRLQLLQCLLVECRILRLRSAILIGDDVGLLWFWRLHQVRRQVEVGQLFLALLQDLRWIDDADVAMPDVLWPI